MTELAKIGPRKEWEPGRYEGVPMHVYHSEIDAINWSTLKLADVSFAHCRDRVQNPELYAEWDKRKQANYNWGSGLHTAIIEPDLFDETYHAHPEGNKNSGAYKAEAQPLIDEGFVLLEQKAIDEIWRARDYFHSQDCQARDLVRAKTAGEVTYVIEGWYGRLYKLRVDLEVESANMMVDLKSTISALRAKFERQATDLSYHCSRVFYMDLMDLRHADVGGPKFDHHLFLAIEKQDPFEFGLFDTTPNAIDKGREEVARLVEGYDVSMKSGIWKGYTRDVQSLDLAGWEYKRLEQAQMDREIYE